MLPYLTQEAPWFAFIVDPRDIGDLDRVGGSDLVRAYSKDDADFVRKICTMDPLVIGEISFGFSPVAGDLTAVLRMPQDILTPEGALLVGAAVQLSIQRGAAVVGLGALTSPATGAGMGLIEHVPEGATITNGSAYTAAVARQNVIEAAGALGMARPRVAVVGCTGSVGVPASHLLVRDDTYDLTLIGRSEERVREVLGELAGQAKFSGDVGDVSDADIVLVLTGSTSARITPAIVRRGSVVVDLAQPANIPKREYPDFVSRGSAVVEGGLALIPGYQCSYDLRIPVAGATFACLAETYLYAVEGIRTHSVGKPSADTASRLERAAERRGILPAPLHVEAVLSRAMSEA